jgi:hypothetical protein
MPAEEGLGLDNEKRLFPTADGPCEQDQKYPIRFATSWTFDLTTKDDQLLAKQCIFGEKFSSGSGKIGECSAQEGVVHWSRPLHNAVAALTKIASKLIHEQRKQYKHSDQAPC